MLIKVKTLTGKEIEIDIEPTDKVDIINVIDVDINEEIYWKVERIKERVEEKEGIPPPQQRLIFSGKQMNDEKTAADYKVRDLFDGGNFFLTFYFLSRFKADQFFILS